MKDEVGRMKIRRGDSSFRLHPSSFVLDPFYANLCAFPKQPSVRLQAFMAWFNKKSKRIEAVPPEERVVKTENVFVKCDDCEEHLYKRDLEEALQVCSHCGHHFRIGAHERLSMIF